MLHSYKALELTEFCLVSYTLYDAGPNEDALESKHVASVLQTKTPVLLFTHSDNLIYHNA